MPTLHRECVYIIITKGMDNLRGSSSIRVSRVEIEFHVLMTFTI